MAGVGFQLNKVVSSTLQTADFTNDTAFVAINLDATFSSGFYIDGVEFIVFVTGTNYNNLLTTEVDIYRNFAANPTIGITPQIAVAERIFLGLSEQQIQRRYLRTFIPPFPLEQGGKYSIVGRMGFSAVTAPVDIFLNVTGRPVPGTEFPLIAR